MQLIDEEIQKLIFHREIISEITVDAHQVFPLDYLVIIADPSARVKGCVQFENSPYACTYQGCLSCKTLVCHLTLPP